MKALRLTLKVKSGTDASKMSPAGGPRSDYCDRTLIIKSDTIFNGPLQKPSFSYEYDLIIYLFNKQKNGNN
jgi:hypothetical protein